MHEITYYKEQNGKSPIKEFLDGLNAKDAQKVVWVLQLIELQRAKFNWQKKES